MEKFNRYGHKGRVLMRKYKKGEDLTGITVSADVYPDLDMGMIGCNIEDYTDQWYIKKADLDPELLKSKK